MTGTMTPGQLAVVLDRVADTLIAARDRLNEADARLGDGDTGTMLERAASAIKHVAAGGDHVSPADLLDRAGQAVADGTGSSPGTLLAVGLRAAARQLADRARVTHRNLAQALETAAAQMRRAGGARPGDKTIVDFLDALAPLLAAGADHLAIQVAADAAMAEFRYRPCRIGRTRLCPDDASIGQDDPGMLAARIATGAICCRDGQGAYQSASVVAARNARSFRPC